MGGGRCCHGCLSGEDTEVKMPEGPMLGAGAVVAVVEESGGPRLKVVSDGDESFSFFSLSDGGVRTFAAESFSSTVAASVESRNWVRPNSSRWFR